MDNYKIKSTNLNLEYKSKIIVSDEYDYGKRLILNFGHTLGHALEALYQYKKISHGDAVYYGMLAASYISFKLGYLSKIELDKIANFINTIDIVKLENIDDDKLLSFIQYDKKQSGNKIRFILLNKIGDAFIHSDVDETTIKESINYINN